MFKKVYSCKSSAEAGLIISLLKTNGFNPLEIETSPHISVAGADLFYYVRVPEEEYESVKQFLLGQSHKDVI